MLFFVVGVSTIAKLSPFDDINDNESDEEEVPITTLNNARSPSSITVG